jgi:hypothetical protein
MTKEITTDLWVCTDCIFLIANGDLPEEPNDYDAGAIGRIWAGYNVVPDGRHEGEDEDADVQTFSWASCDGCNSHLGGARHRCAAIKETVDD